MQKDLLIQAGGRAAATLVYISVVAWVMSNGSRWFGEKDTAITPVFILLLFVVSATITGFLVLGKPVTLYLDGAKKEAVRFLFATVGWLAAFLVAVGVFMALR